MHTIPKKRKQAGFTLIEIIAVLVILGVLAAVAVPRYIDLQDEAELRAIDAGIAELNSRENLTWSEEKLSSGWTNDATTFAAMDTNLGAKYSWSTTASVTGGVLDFGNESKTLTRTASTTESPASWAEATPAPAAEAGGGSGGGGGA